ncbi:MAG TPA: hypothetical protein VKV28_08635 [Candidatus Binataceae bacterium]|nr:hypothetical protein [Candidatus Binataceae bacterium]
MGKLIDLAEVRRARRRHAAEQKRQALTRAVELIEINLELAQVQMAQARGPRRLELIGRAQKLKEVLAYARGML